MTREQELAVIRRVQRGDANAFEYLVAAYEKNVYNLALRMTGNPEDAEDMAQEAFLKAYSSLDSFRGDSKFSVWLYRIVSNTCLDFLRVRSRRRETSLEREDEGAGTGQQEIPDDSLSPERLFERKLTRESVQRGLMSLPEDQRKILLLREIEGLSYEEIAHVLSLESGTVKSRIFRARRRLCVFLASDGNISTPVSSKRSGGGETP